MKIELTLEEVIYIYNRLSGKEIDSAEELFFLHYESKKLALKLKRQIDKEIIAEGWNG